MCRRVCRTTPIHHRGGGRRQRHRRARQGCVVRLVVRHRPGSRSGARTKVLPRTPIRRRRGQREACGERLGSFANDLPPVASLAFLTSGAINAGMRKIDWTFAPFCGTSPRHRVLRTKAVRVIHALSPGDGADELLHRFSHICLNFRGVIRPRLPSAP